jgi:hypothetical protein
MLKHGTGSCPHGRVLAGEIKAAVIDQLRLVSCKPERPAPRPTEWVRQMRARLCRNSIRCGRTLPRRAGAHSGAVG